MKKIFQLVLVCSLVSLQAFAASDKANQTAYGLIKKAKGVRARFHKLEATPIVKFLPSPEGSLEQGSEYSVFISPINTYSDSNILLDATLDESTNAVPLIHSSDNLWIFHADGFSELRTHTLNIALSIENKALAKQLRSSIDTIDSQITALQKKIDKETDPVKKQSLIAERDEKVAIKNELIRQLAALKTPVSSQSFAFEVVPSSNNVDYPKLAGVSPQAGSAGGGTSITITGQNFVSGMIVKIGGIPAQSATFVDSQTITAVTPSFNDVTGIKDLEIVFPPLSGSTEVRNSFLKNAFFATNSSLEANVKPVALAGSPQSINLGEVAQLDGSASYDPNPGTTLSYEWKVFSAPAGSNLSVGQSLDPVANPQVSPNTAGLYVFELKVTEANTQDHLVSDPSYESVEVKGPVNHAPVPTAEPIVTQSNQPGSTTVVANDPDLNQTATFAIVTAPQNGSAVVNSIGVVTYTPSNNFEGTDSLVVRVSDNGSPIMVGEVTIPVTVNHLNRAPAPTAPAISVDQGATATTQVSANDPDAGDTETYAITTQPQHGSALVDTSGLVSFTANSDFAGSDSLVVTVTDNEGASGSVNIPITINSTNHAPVPTASNITVTAGQSAASQISTNDPDAGQTFTYQVVTQGTKGTASVDASGLVSYTANSSTSGSDSVVVRVTDSGIPAMNGDVTISVNINLPPNQPPVLGQSFNFLRTEGFPVNVRLGNVGASDPDGTIVAWTVDFGDGSPLLQVPQGSFLGGTGFALFHDFVNAGTFTVTMTAKDNLGATTTGTQTVVVERKGIPSAIGKPDVISGSVPLTVTFDSSESIFPDPSAPLQAYFWNFGDGTTNEVDPSFVTRSHTYSTPGVYNVVHRTRDTKGGEGESVIKIYAGVTPPAAGTPPVAHLAILPDREAPIGSAVTFDGSYSYDPNPAGSISEYDWDFNDFFSCPGTVCSGTGQITSHTFTQATNYFPSLTVRNAVGGSGFAPTEMWVVNTGHAPHPIVIPNASVTGVAPFTVTESGILSFDYDGTIQNYEWWFDDHNACPDDGVGCKVQGPFASHTYDVPGVYNLRLIVTDNDGNKTAAFRTVTVTPTLARTKIAALDDDAERAERRRVLTGACGTGNAEACYYLSQMYSEDGDTFTAGKFKEKSCSMGYQPACSLK